jgi:hypothetical protein
MYRKIQDVALKTGEKAELGLLVGPDGSELATQTKKLLGHKGPIWNWQIAASLAEGYPSVDSRFYILLKDSVPFANIMTCSSHGVGVFGHVFTTPEQRRKGAADIIHHYLMEDFKRSGGKALYLGTGYDTHPYRLYAKYGFQGAEPKSGYMYWFADGQEAFEAAAFAPAKTRHEALGYQHWPTLPALAMMRHSARVRIATMGVINIRSSEGGSLGFMHEPDARASGARAWVAVSEQSHVPVAIAAAKADWLFGDQVDVVDLFCAPGFEAEVPPLLAQLKLPSERQAVCYADTQWKGKAAILRSCGFRKAGDVKRHLRVVDDVCDLELWSK